MVDLGMRIVNCDEKEILPISRKERKRDHDFGWKQRLVVAGRDETFHNLHGSTRLWRERQTQETFRGQGQILVTML